MRFFGLSSLAAIAAASSSLEHKVEEIHVSAVKEVAPVITVVDLNRTYAVRYECAGCPFGVLKSSHEAEWVHPPPDSSLMLMLDIDNSGTALLLNDERIFPLDPMPPRISAIQVPMSLGKEDADPEKVMSKSIRFPLQYEHTLFRAEGDNELWLQFNVTGLAWGEESAPFKMGQKVVQVLLREHDAHQQVEGQEGYGHPISIAEVSVVGDEDRAQPPRMKCGRLAMVRTSYDPNEWDEYGKYGTWARTWNLIVGKLCAFWSAHVQSSNLLLPLALLLVVSIVVARRICQLRQQERVGGGSAAETSLLGCHAAPPYTDVPVIKIEQYD